jgi:hypothetical protein
MKKIDNKKLIDRVYKKYKNSVNMSFVELKIWSRNKLSRKASLDRKPINRNLKLLSKNKSEWNLRDVKEANKTISFIARMKKVKSGKKINGKLSKRDISLLNWAYNPYK